VYLNVRWTLEEIQDECPDNLQVAAREIRELVDRFLRGETGLQDDIQTRLQGLDGELTLSSFTLKQSKKPLTASKH